MSACHRLCIQQSQGTHDTIVLEKEKSQGSPCIIEAETKLPDGGGRHIIIHVAAARKRADFDHVADEQRAYGAKALLCHLDAHFTHVYSIGHNPGRNGLSIQRQSLRK